MQEVQKPTVGRQVYYVSRGSLDGKFPPANRAATVTEVHPDNPYIVGLCVINPSGLFFHSLADGGISLNTRGDVTGTWHWPPRV
ncbi:MAG: hypothetical protein IPH08_03885 [Rhodocyclaceae bacterium]|nr:hypothetical protein [Rhodocyclaceae bacterium]